MVVLLVVVVVRVVVATVICKKMEKYRSPQHVAV